MEPTFFHYLVVAAMIVAPMIIKSRLITLFAAGFFTHAGITMAVQDWIGQAQYLIYVADNWINFHWLVGAVVAVACTYTAIKSAASIKHFTIWTIYKVATDVSRGDVDIKKFYRPAGEPPTDFLKPIHEQREEANRNQAD